MKAYRLKIYGIVQGVWFRASTKERADQYGISGWVRNAADGSVEAYAQGPDEVVDLFLHWCKQGPPGARVDRIETEETPPGPDVRGFMIRR